MMMNKAGQVRVGDNQTAPVLNYNVPEPTTYSGRTYIELDIADSSFLPVETGMKRVNAFNTLAAAGQSQLEQSPLEELRRIRQSGDRMTTALKNLTEEEITLQMQEGKRLSLFLTMTGAWSHRFASNQTAAQLDGWNDGSTAADLAENTDGTNDDFAAKALAVKALPIKDSGDSDESLIRLPTREPEVPGDGGGGGSYPDPSIFVSISSPSSNTTYTGPYTGAVIDINGITYAAEGSVDVIRVRINNGGWMTPELNGTSWSLSNVTIKLKGEVTIEAEAYHSNGYLQKSVTRKIRVELGPEPDTSKPSIAITSPTSGAVLAVHNGPAANITVTGTASDNRGVTRVELFLDGQSVGMATTGNQFAAWSKAISVPAGSHTILARAYDEANLSSDASVSVSVDTTAPTISIVSPAPNTAIAGTYTKGAVIEVTGTSADNSGVKLVEVSLNNSPAYINAVAKASDDWSTWKATLKVDLPGLCVIKARATDMSGNTVEAATQVNVTILPEVSSRKNRIILIESYRLSSFLSNYGAGRTLKTFSLLPGEKSKISIRTYAQKEETMKSASTILDSVTDDIASEFEKSIGNETSNKTGYESSNDYKLEASVGVSWGGWLNASASASTSGATNAAREQLTKNIVNSTQKHVSKASARRDMQIDTSYEVKTTSTDETSIVREIENINMSRTLNFVFRQMNQEFITLLHLVDVRIGFYRDEKIEGEGNSYYQEVTLPELDKLLADIIVPEKRAEIRNTIIHQLMNIFDYQDRHHAFVEEAALKDDSGAVIPLTNYLRVKKDYYSTYVDEASGSTIKVPGIIMAANQHVLRTDGIVVEAVLGQGEALDDYSSDLQKQSVREKELKNDLLQAEVRMRELALQILEAKDQTAAQMFALLNNQQAPEEEAETVTV